MRLVTSSSDDSKMFSGVVAEVSELGLGDTSRLLGCVVAAVLEGSPGGSPPGADALTLGVALGVILLRPYS